MQARIHFLRRAEKTIQNPSSQNNGLGERELIVQLLIRNSPNPNHSITIVGNKPEDSSVTNSEVERGRTKHAAVSETNHPTGLAQMDHVFYLACHDLRS